MSQASSLALVLKLIRDVTNKYIRWGDTAKSRQTFHRRDLQLRATTNLGQERLQSSAEILVPRSQRTQGIAGSNCKNFGAVSQTRLQVVPVFPQGQQSKRNPSARKITPREGERFLAWGDFHARLSFARSTIPEEKWGLLVVYATNGLSELFKEDALNLLLRRVFKSNEQKNTKKYSE